MEALEEPPLMHDAREDVKAVPSDEITVTVETAETEVCHTSNGVSESDAELKNEQETVPEPPTAVTVVEEITECITKCEVENDETVTAVTEPEPPIVEEEETAMDEFVVTEIAAVIKEAESTEQESCDGNTVVVTEESVVEVDGIVDNGAENITFETEIYVENTAELDNHIDTVTCDEPDSSNILSELGQNIELSDVLRSSDVSETVENNNCEQEVFNKEELLDILEGNDVEESRKMISDHFIADSKKLEEHLAIQQLHRLKSSDTRKNKRKSPKKVEKRQSKRTSSHNTLKEAKVDETPKKESTIMKEAKSKIDSTSKKEGNASKVLKAVVDDSSVQKEAKSKVDEPLKKESTISKVAKVDDKQSKESIVPKVDETQNKDLSQVAIAQVDETGNKECIVTALVRDWEDDEQVELDASKTLLNESAALLESTEELAKSQETMVTEEDKQNEESENHVDPSANEDPTATNKLEDPSQPQRRLGRVIKKKVIFDPDNPDTFTKTKAHIKKERDISNEKDQSATKKIKPDQPSQRPKSKSPVSKMQWKKPPPKPNSNKYKRLTEIDKLLMDEGAVNMICQLTPEAPKGNKNMKSRAEFIKNIQSNTPDTKEMKFRERKSKSVKSEDGDAKKVGSGKLRLSLSTSVKSPTVSEDFEAHSADDSIIYRRHSSSSYSSSCMSPRRLSDVDGSVSTQATAAVNQTAPPEVYEVTVIESNDTDSFMGKTSTPKTSEIMNKSDCLSIKEKLNNKLSQALNKRKRDHIKSEKPSKVKKVTPVEEISTDVTVHFNQKIAEICIRKAGSVFSIQIMKVLENILSLVDSNSNIVVTLITSECGTVCSGMDLKPILDDVKYAHEIAQQARLLLHCLEKHSKLLIIGVEGKTHGFSLALAALSDVLLASENATFALSERGNTLMYPGVTVLNSRGLPQSLVNNMVMFGQELSAAEALQSGLVSRVIWPERFPEQVRAIAKDIAAQPFERIMLKKQLLGLKKIGSASTFQTSLEKERDLLVKYWTSEEGQALLRANVDA